MVVQFSRKPNRNPPSRSWRSLPPSAIHYILYSTTLVLLYLPATAPPSKLIMWFFSGLKPLASFLFKPSAFGNTVAG